MLMFPADNGDKVGTFRNNHRKNAERKECDQNQWDFIAQSGLESHLYIYYSPELYIPSKTGRLHLDVPPAELQPRACLCSCSSNYADSGPQY